ncbi:MAG TPA: hypothetical protein VFN10_06265 [Thermoanaerobaculia bacterium]|nr:hypothetical protein [Thermoanaerobaculia bacterium]
MDRKRFTARLSLASRDEFPGSRGVVNHYTSLPQVVDEFAEFCALMTSRYT